MGKNYTVSLTTEEEKKAKKLVESGQYRSVYAIIKTGLRRLLYGHKN